MCNWSRFCKTMIGMVFFPIFIVPLLFEGILYRVNEQKVGTEKAIEMSLHEKVLYGSALSGDVSFLKYGVVKQLQPDILAIGSSRVMQFRRSFFKDATFYTMGGLCDSIGDLSDVYHTISKHYTPKIIILEVAWCWLNPTRSHPLMLRPFMEERIISRRSYLYKCLSDSIRKNKRVRDHLIEADVKTQDEVGGRATIGLMAGVDYRGFREDGSFQYGQCILDLIPAEERMKNSHELIKNNNWRFAEAYDIDQKELSKLQTLIQEMKRNGCHVIVFLAPFSNEIYEELLSSPKHKTFMEKYERDVKELCNQETVSFYDFSNMQWVGSTDEEAIDGFHGSERTYGRIMLHFLQDKKIAPYVNAELIRDRLEASDSPIQLLNYEE